MKEEVTSKVKGSTFFDILIVEVIVVCIMVVFGLGAKGQGIDPTNGKPFRNFDPKTFALFEIDLTPQMLDTTELESAVHPVQMKFIGMNYRYEWKSDSLILVYDQNHILKGISFPSNVTIGNLTVAATNIETGEVRRWSVIAYKVRCRHNLCKNTN